jgi:hypothetical protein
LRNPSERSPPTEQDRRFTRLTNAFSKKWENHQAMFALFAAWSNFCRKHQTLKMMPQLARWRLEERAAALAPAPKSKPQLGPGRFRPTELQGLTP